MSDFWNILLLAGLLWILFIAGAFIYYRIIKPTKSGRASRMEETDDEFCHRLAKFKNNWKPEIEIVTQNDPRTD